MALTYRTVASGNSGSSSTTNANITTVVGDLLVAFYESDSVGVGAVTVTDSVAGVTWAEATTAVYNGSTNTVRMFVRNALATTAAANTITATDVGSGKSAASLAVIAISGATMGGLSNVIQTATNPNLASGTTPTGTFNNTTDSSSLTIAVAAAKAITPPTGWTERFDGGRSTSDSLEIATRDSGFAGTIVTWGSTTGSGYAVILAEMTPGIGTGLTTSSISLSTGSVFSSQSITGSSSSTTQGTISSSQRLTGQSTSFFKGLLTANPGLVGQSIIPNAGVVGPVGSNISIDQGSVSFYTLTDIGNIGWGSTTYSEISYADSIIPVPDIFAALAGSSFTATSGNIKSVAVPLTGSSTTVNTGSASGSQKLTGQWVRSYQSVKNWLRNSTAQGAVVGIPGTWPIDWGIGGNAYASLARQVVGTGIDADGIDYIDIRLSGTVPSVANPEVVIPFEVTSGTAAIKASKGQQWTASVYAMVVGGTLTGVLGGEVFIIGNTQTGTLIEAQSAPFSYSASGNLADNRKTKTYTLTGIKTELVYSRLDLNLIAGAALDITIRIGLPQLELGATATDTVKTYGTVIGQVYGSQSMAGQETTTDQGSASSSQILSGSNATVVQGNEGLSRSNSLSGTSITGSQGKPVSSQRLIGSSIAGQSGVIIASQKIVGSSAAISIGNVVASQPLSNQQISFVQGDEGVTRTKSLVGQAIVSSPGSILYGRPLVGLATTGQLSSVLYTVSLTGQQTSSQQDNIQATPTVSLVNQPITSFTGTLKSARNKSISGQQFALSISSVEAGQPLTNQTISTSTGSLGSTRILSLIGSETTTIDGTIEYHEPFDIGENGWGSTSYAEITYSGSIIPSNDRFVELVGYSALLSTGSITASQRLTGKTIDTSSGNLRGTQRLTGTGATGQQGSLTDLHIFSLSGESITPTSGSITNSNVVQLGTQSITIQQRSVATLKYYPLTGQTIISSVGTIKLEIPTFGNQIASGIGSLRATRSISLVGQSITTTTSSVNAAQRLIGEPTSTAQGTIAYTVKMIGQMINTSVGVMFSEQRLTGQSILSGDGDVGLPATTIPLLGIVVLSQEGTFAQTANLGKQTLSINAGTMRAAPRLVGTSVDFSVGTITVAPDLRGTSIITQQNRVGVACGLNGLQIGSLSLGSVNYLNKPDASSQQITTKQGAFENVHTVAISGISVSINIGALDDSGHFTISGQDIVASQGSFLSSITKSITGQSLAVSASSLDENDSIKAGITGQEIGVEQDSVLVVISDDLSNQEIAIQSGVLKPNTTTSVIGIDVGILDIGDVILDIEKSLLGKDLSSSTGSISYSQSISGSFGFLFNGEVNVSHRRNLIGLNSTVGLNNFIRFTTVALKGRSMGVNQGSLKADYRYILTGQRTDTAVGSSFSSRSSNLFGQPFSTQFNNASSIRLMSLSGEESIIDEGSVTSANKIVPINQSAFLFAGSLAKSNTIRLAGLNVVLTQSSLDQNELISDDIVGSEVHSDQGSLVISRSQMLNDTGVYSIVAQGLLTPVASLTGTALNASSGAINTVISQPLVGSSITTQNGFLGQSYGKNITGTESTLSNGRFSLEYSFDLTGEQIGSSIGDTFHSLSGLFGSSATVYGGKLSTDSVTNLIGQSLIPETGLVGDVKTVRLIGEEIGSEFDQIEPANATGLSGHSVIIDSGEPVFIYTQSLFGQEIVSAVNDLGRSTFKSLNKLSTTIGLGSLGKSRATDLSGKSSNVSFGLIKISTQKKISGELINSQNGSFKFIDKSENLKSKTIITMTGQLSGSRGDMMGSSAFVAQGTLVAGQRISSNRTIFQQGHVGVVKTANVIGNDVSITDGSIKSASNDEVYGQNVSIAIGSLRKSIQIGLRGQSVNSIADVLGGSQSLFGRSTTISAGNVDSLLTNNIIENTARGQTGSVGSNRSVQIRGEQSAIAISQLNASQKLLGSFGFVLPGSIANKRNDIKIVGVVSASRSGVVKATPTHTLTGNVESIEQGSIQHTRQNDLKGIVASITQTKSKPQFDMSLSGQESIIEQDFIVEQHRDDMVGMAVVSQIGTLTATNDPALSGQEIVGSTDTVIPKNKILDGETFVSQEGSVTSQTAIGLAGMRIQLMIGRMRAKNTYADLMGTDGGSFFQTDAVNDNFYELQANQRKKQAESNRQYEDDLITIMSVVDLVLSQ